jgi:asparagine synthase (glutamine-hydrolysing)
MCAISVIWNTEAGADARALQQASLVALGPYGPDRRSAWSDGPIALGINSSINLPEDIFDAQPIWSQDRSACMVSDVRLDNRAELAGKLDLRDPPGLSDSAFLMAAWLRWGTSCFDHILGAFAFAVWMPQRQEIFAARDHTGEQPLFYHRGKNLFALASMPKGLLALPSVSSAMRESYLADWIGALKPDPSSTFYQEVDRVLPGHFIRVTRDSFESRRYWHPTDAKPTRYKRDQDYAEALVELLDRATEARLRSTRPVGSFLSAGLDSSSITASAARLLAAEGKSLTSFTSVPRPGFDGKSDRWHLPHEAEGAAEVARLYPNIEHRTVDSCGYDLLTTTNAWTDAMDQPVLNVVNTLWYTAILDQARQSGIGVMLDGTTGNVTISYNSWNILNQFLRRGQWIRLLRTAHALNRRGAITWRGSARCATRSLIPMGLTRALVPKKNLEGVYDFLANPQWIKRFHLKERIFNSIYTPPRSLVEEHTNLFDGYDIGPIRAGAQALTGVEVRDPASDKRIYEFCFSIPREQYIAGGDSRSLIRRAMQGRLPQSTLNRYTRGLQGADWYIPMTESLPAMRDEILRLKESPAAAEALDLPAMQKLLDTWPQSGFHTRSVGLKYHSWLTRAFSMGYFLRSHESQPSASPLPTPPVSSAAL